MNKKLEDILDEALAPEMKAQLQEAFNVKLDEFRKELEEKHAAEMASRYEHDKSEMVEAMGQMLSDVARIHEEEKIEELKKLRESRKSYNEYKSILGKRLKEMADSSGKLIKSRLNKEIQSLTEEKRNFSSKATVMANEVASIKEQLTENHKRHLVKINEFVMTQLKKEINEFDQDKKALVEARVKLITESKKKLKETQTKFIREAARKVERNVKNTLKREMTQLHEDLERNRQNSFGRRIFEAVAAEFATSHLSEGTEIRKVMEAMKAKDAEIAAKEKVIEATTAKLNEAKQATHMAARRVALAEQKVERNQIMSELLSSLKGDKKSIMASLLETTKTSQLRESFNKFMPVVLEETKAAPAPMGKRVLSESRKIPKSTITTGDRNYRFAPKSSEETENDTERAAILRLAGIKSK